MVIGPKKTALLAAPDSLPRLSRNHLQMSSNQQGAKFSPAPGLAEFYAGLAKAESELLPGGRPHITEVRRIAEAAPKTWTKGGPVMHRVADTTVETPHGTVRVRIFYPNDAENKPVLVYLHGGGWTIFSLETHDRIMREYAARANVAVVGVDYSLSPEAKFPVALVQSVAVIRWLRENGNSLGLDRTRLSVGGDSAGGNLSIAAGLMLRDQGFSSMLRAMVLNYSVFDRDFTRPSYQRFGGGDMILNIDEMKGFWDNYLPDAKAKENPYAVPVLADLRGLPPCFMAITEADVLHDENVEMALRLQAAGVPVKSVVYEGTAHSFLEAVSIAEVSRKALADGSHWLSDILRR